MNKLGIAFWCALIMGAFVLLYFVRYQTQNTQSEIAGIEQRILEEKEAIHVLRAEWSYLTRPERLKQLTAQLKDMEPVTQQKVIALTDIPLQEAPEGLAEAASHAPQKELLQQEAVDPLPVARPRIEQVAARPALAAVPAPRIQSPVRRIVATATPEIKAVVVNHTIQQPAAEPLQSWDVLVPDER